MFVLEPESITNTALVNFYPVTTEIFFGLLALFLLFVFSSLISGAEVSFLSLSPSERSMVNSSKKKSHQLIRNLLAAPDKLLTTFFIVNTFSWVTIIILATYIFSSLVVFSNLTVANLIIQILIISGFILLFVEILPRMAANNMRVKMATFMARPVYFLSILFYPLSYFLVHVTSNHRNTSQGSNLSIDEISQALELTTSEENMEDNGILEGIVKFGSTNVYQIMTPRIDVVAINIETPAEKIIEIINHSGYSRIPVYAETFDKVEGILYNKDLLPFINNIESLEWQSLLRQPYYIPENKKIDDLLKEFQKNKVHMAIVVDEYGGTSGIVTLEDILEEIVGDISDEFDDDEDAFFTKINEFTYIFDGKTQLNDFYRVCNLDDHLFDEIKGEADSLAGLLLEIKSNFPKLNEKISFENIDFFIEALDKRRIKKIKVVFNNV